MFEQDFTSDIIWVSSILFPDLSKQWASNEVLSMVSYTGLPFRADTDIHEVELGSSDSGKMNKNVKFRMHARLTLLDILDISAITVQQNSNCETSAISNSEQPGKIPSGDGAARLPCTGFEHCICNIPTLL